MSFGKKCIVYSAVHSLLLPFISVSFVNKLKVLVKKCIIFMLPSPPFPTGMGFSRKSSKYYRILQPPPPITTLPLHENIYLEVLQNPAISDIVSVDGSGASTDSIVSVCNFWKNVCSLSLFYVIY